MSPIYLDNAATTRMHPSVAAAMSDCYQVGYLNPSSQHALGRRARAVLDDARDEITTLLGGASGCQLFVTSGGTESNNLAVNGLCGASPGRIVVSEIEHPSVIAAAQQLNRRGYDVQWIPTLVTGSIDLDAALDLISPETRLVSIMLGNHETGVLQPIEPVARRCMELGVNFHIDAVQAVGKVPVHFTELQITAMTVAPHKFHGPRGVGALLVKPGCELDPLLVGGSQQFGIRPGTEDVALTVGMLTALRLINASLDDRHERLYQARDSFERLICSMIEQATINGSAAKRLPHISNIGFPGLDRQALLMALDMLGLACATGSACTSGSSEPSAVLLSMGLPRAVVESSLRFSFAADTTAADVSNAAEHIFKAVNNLQA